MQMLGDFAVKLLQLENRAYEDYLDPKLRQNNESMLTIISSVLRTVRYLYNIHRFNKRSEMMDLEFTFLLLIDWIRLLDLRYNILLGASGAAGYPDLSSSLCIGCSAVGLNLDLAVLLLGCY